MTARVRFLALRVAVLLLLHALLLEGMVRWRAMESLLAGGADGGPGMVVLAAGFIVIRVMVFALVPGMVVLLLGMIVHDRLYRGGGSSTGASTGS